MTVIGIDAHKRSHTCVAVNDAGAKVAEKTVASVVLVTHRRFDGRSHDSAPIFPGESRICAR
jgi:hypothetical protein